jgi:hypothetical protein
VSSQISVTTPPTRPAPRFTGLAAATLAVAATLVLIIGVRVIDAGASNLADSVSEAAVVYQMHRVGYPLHGGLAGPSRVSPNALGDHHGPGYPLHGGLAGPSQPSVTDHAGHHGPGYPLHGGLAGPSVVRNED